MASPTAPILLALAALPLAAAQEPIRFTLRFPAAPVNYVEVTARVPSAGAPTVELMMPVWTPGSYLVREYARNVEDFAARAPGGASLPVRKSRKNRWRIESAGAREIDVSYRVYCRAMSVQGAYVDRDFAILNGAAIFVTLAADSGPRPHEVFLDLPPNWRTAISALPSTDRPNTFRAPDYDTLVDSPIVAGNPAVYEFEAGGRSHYLVNVGEGAVWDGPRSARDTERIVRENLRLWGSLPYGRYVFFNILSESGGGLEHRNSTLMMTSRWSTRTEKSYLRWLGLVSHEYFHAWNVKRLRPVELGPFDYESEDYTRSLWIAEGVTSYYAALTLSRAGLARRDDTLEGLSNAIGRLQNAPGRRVQPLELASFDAWIKEYRPDENSVNTAISYYTKGAIVGFLLDAKIRRATNGAKSLDDVMRLAFRRYSGARGYTPAEFRQTAEEVAGVPLSDWFATTLETTEELDYGEALAWFGLRFKPEEPPQPDAPPKAEKAWTGFASRVVNGRLVVMEVLRGTPADQAGFNVEDEILGIDDYRVRPDQLAARLESYRPGDTVAFLVARRDQLLRLRTTLAAEPRAAWKLEVDPKADEERKAHRKAWLEGAL